MLRSLAASALSHIGIGIVAWAAFGAHPPEVRQPPVGVLVVRPERVLDTETLEVPAWTSPSAATRPLDTEVEPETEPVEVEFDRPEPVEVDPWRPGRELARVVRRRPRTPQDATEKPKQVAKPAPEAPPPLEAARPARGLNTPVRYPARAARLGHEGTVLLRVRVGMDGSALAVEVLRSSGHGTLDGAARAAVKRWRFHPARRGGRPEPQWIRVPIRFRLSG